MRIFTQRCNVNEFLVLDIDNTIADTWKNLNDFKNGRFAYFSNLEPLEGTIKYIKENYDDLPILFLSNRNIVDYNVTEKWLKKISFNAPQILILTNNPQDKLVYLKFLSERFGVVYFDDLSYNHEKDKVLFYDDVIKEVEKMNVKYYDYFSILKLNKH
ncbi:hypothetical protein [Flavobacterium sp. H122]|uniref:hypothetical protein n=1 Tax=Flavobacterium sp. H122 TaxID=2529860 RepID=UPI0010A9F0A3|nr:hypothetical protein [Flavobacterium sp. H122]